jgi:outer membrane protein OmpA-like peptidoglycan-associated protein
MKTAKKILDFMIRNTSSIESIQIYGYCDDRGTADYIIINYRNKVSYHSKSSNVNQFNKNKILIIEGKGRVILTENLLENLGEIRSKNRRVDLLLVKKKTVLKDLQLFSG